MRYRKLHPWNVSIAEAREIQLRLRRRLAHKAPEKIKTIAACDVGYKDGVAHGVVVVFSYPDLKLEEKAEVTNRFSFPYVPGFLTFREGPITLQAFAKLKAKPDAVLFDGQGIAHPRGMGEAAHLGLWLNIPSIGCAKSRLYGEYKEPGKKKGSYSYLVAEGKRVGAVLRTKAGTKPIFVSPGHRVDFKSSIQIVMNCVTKYRIPEPLRYAHQQTQK